MNLEIELQTLWAAPKHIEQTTLLMGSEMKLLDGPSFVSQYRQIVIGEAYSFEFDSDNPVIIDGGANIGVASLWWRWKWPRALIVAFEPDPRVFEFLTWNLRNHTEVILRQRALAATEGSLTFHSEGADGGSLILPSISSSPLLQVQTSRLSTLIDELGKIDLLKLDIEGAELPVLLEAETRLFKVERMFIEYHSFSKQKQELSELLALLERNGFRYYIEDESKRNKPLERGKGNMMMDLQLDIWAFRSHI